MIQAKRERGSLLLAVLFMVVCSFLAVAFISLLPVASRAVVDSEFHQRGSMVAEAGIAEAIAFLETLPGTTVPSDGDTLAALPVGTVGNNWSYSVRFETGTGAPAYAVAVPDGFIRTRSTASFLGRDYVEAVAYFQIPPTDQFFFDMVRAEGVMRLAAGGGTEYFNSVHTNDFLRIDLEGLGWGNPPSFHAPVTWSDTSQADPEVNGFPGGSVNWDKLSDNGGRANFGDPDFVDPRELPNLDPADPENIISGASNPDSLLSQALDGNAFAGTDRVEVYEDGGVVISNDEVETMKFSLVDAPNLTGTEVPFDHDWDPSTQHFPGYTPAQVTSSLHQKMEVTFNGDASPWTVIFDEASDTVKVWNPSGALVATVNGQTNGIIYSDKRIAHVEGPIKNKRTIVSNAEVRVKLEDDLASLFRADLEPYAEAVVVNGSNTKRPYITPDYLDGNGQARDGLTLASPDRVRWEVQPPPGGRSGSAPQSKNYFLYGNMLAGDLIRIENVSGSQFTVNVSGSAYSMNEYRIDRQGQNDDYKFIQDPTNVTVAGLSNDKPRKYSVYHYEESFFRGGR